MSFALHIFSKIAMLIPGLSSQGLQSEIQELERQAQSLERTLQLVKPLGEHDTFQVMTQN